MVNSTTTTVLVNIKSYKMMNNTWIINVSLGRERERERERGGRVCVCVREREIERERGCKSASGGRTY